MEKESRLKITEIFHSIQGESTLAGERFSFVRLTGCPLRCSYCDTTYSFTGGKWMNIDEIAEEVATHQTKWVLITGGEPLSQKNCLKLVEHLNQIGKNISIETSGEISIEQYAGLAKIIMDVKTPSSEETATVCFENFKYLLPTDEIKFVIQDEKDYLFAKNICSTYVLEDRFTVLFSPVFDVLPLKQMSEWILRDKLNVRMQTQLHKYIWGKNVHGV